MERLESDRGAAPVEGLAAYGRGEGAAGALAAHREPAAVPAVLGAVRGHPLDHLVGLVRRRGERVLGRDHVVHVEDGHPRSRCKEPTERVVAVGQRQDVPAAVEVDVDR